MRKLGTHGGKHSLCYIRLYRVSRRFLGREALDYALYECRMHCFCSVLQAMGLRAILQHHVHGMQDKIQTVRYTNVAISDGYSDRGRIECGSSGLKTLLSTPSARYNGSSLRDVTTEEVFHGPSQVVSLPEVAVVALHVHKMEVGQANGRVK